jgi:DNA polymerase type B, organellar and viral
MTSKAYDKNGKRYSDGPNRAGARGHNYATRKLYKPVAQFRGVDGEGGNVAEEGTLFGVRHQYLSLRAGPDLLETGSPLSWHECLSFLASLDPSYIYISYFFDYDVTMVVRTLPEERARRLLYPALRTAEGAHWAAPVDLTAPDGSEYQIDYLPHKEFRVRRRVQWRHEQGICQDSWGPWIVLSDVGQFFQSSFLTTLIKWNVGTEAEREMIRAGKAKRADFGVFNEETRAYNALECVLLEQVMTEFRDVCEETGYVPKKWQGPGYLASAMLAAHGVPKRDDIPILKNDSFRLLAQAAYYGGRFETTAAGPIRRTVYQYDINGAYVSLLRGLPCLLHGSWRRVHDRPSGGTWFGQVHFNHDRVGRLYHLPVRLKNGNIQYPREATGVYWSCEVEAAEAAGTRTDFIEGWVYEPACDCRWFDFVDDYYAERLRLGKSAKGMVLKLAGNSVYGKIAQSIGYAPYANPVWAGLITAGCRAQLVNAYAQAPDDCYMLATDGLFTGKRLDVKISRELGDWEETVHDNGIFIVQPGIYFAGDEPKSRGVERGRITDMRAVFEAQWDKFAASRGTDHTVSIPVDNFITAKQALQRNKWDIAGTWDKQLRQVSFWWVTKRANGIIDWEPDLGLREMCRTRPPDVGPGFISFAYDRMIGGQLRNVEERYRDPGLLEAERMAEQPDWVEPLFAME